MSNPFLALQDLDDEEEEVVPKPPPPKPAWAPPPIYKIIHGTQITGGVVPEAHGVGSLRGHQATFYGRCYICDYPAHSQKHCPLRQCTRCREWGHADRACRKQQPWILPAADRTPFFSRNK